MKSIKKGGIAFFDFDGTVTKKDSFVDFLRFSLGKLKFFGGMLLLSPFILLYLANIYPQKKMKELTLKFFYRGYAIANFKEVCHQYSRQKLPRIIRTEAQKKINWHLNNGHDVAIVTATLEYYLKEWCEKQKITLIATKIGVVSDRITGKVKGKVCSGEEKVIRIKEKFDLKNYKRVYAYGDSRGDLPMLGLAQIKYYQWKKIN